MKVGMIGAGSVAGIMAGTIKEVDCAQNYAVATRDYGRAAEFAQKCGFEEAYGSYEELVEDAGVEFVYIATPHSHHYEHIRLCLNHGKHVLCEKSFTINESQIRKVFELVREKKLLLTGTIWTRYILMEKALDDVLLSGVIGRPYMFTANLGYIINGKERIMRPELARGALLDVEICPLNFASTVFGDEVDTITGTAMMTETGVDAQNSITITCGDDRVAVPCSGAIKLSDRRGIIYGNNGSIEVENINNYESIRTHNRPRNMIASYDTPKQISGYKYGMEAYLWTIEKGALEYPEVPHGETLQVMGWVDELRRQWGLVYPMEEQKSMNPLMPSGNRNRIFELGMEIIQKARKSFDGTCVF